MDFEIESQETDARAARAPSERVEVWYLPEYYADNQNAGKFHPGVPRRKIGALNDTDDLEGTLRKLASGPGAYYVAHLIGRDTITSDVFQLAPKGQSLTIDSPQSARRVEEAPPKKSDAHVLSQSHQSEQSSAQAINATADTIRATKELLREVAPNQSNPTPPDVAKIIPEAVAEAVEDLRSQPLSTKQDDPLALVERVIELQKKLAPEQLPRDELSGDDRAQLTLLRKSGLISEFYANMREMWRAPEAAPEPEGFGPALVDFAKQVLPYVGPTVGPMLGQKLNELMAHVDVNSLAQRLNAPPQSGPPVGPHGATANADPRLVAYSRVIRRVVADLVDNLPIDAAVAASIQLVSAFPDFAPQFGQIVNATPDDVAAFIHAQTQEDVRALPHCSEWIVAYQSKLRAAGSPDASMPPRRDESESDDDGPLTFDDVLRFIKQQIIEDEEPAAAVSSVIQLLAEQPDLAPMVHQLLANANTELVQFLSQATQTDLTIVANAESFIEKLKAGVAERLRVPVNLSENGHKNAQAKEVSRASA